MDILKIITEKFHAYGKGAWDMEDGFLVAVLEEMYGSPWAVDRERLEASTDYLCGYLVGAQMVGDAQENEDMKHLLERIVQQFAQTQPLSGGRV